MPICVVFKDIIDFLMPRCYYYYSVLYLDKHRYVQFNKELDYELHTLTTNLLNAYTDIKL